MNSKTIGIFMMFGALTLCSQWAFSSGLCKRAFQKIWKNKPTISRVEVKDPVIVKKVDDVHQMLRDYIFAIKYYRTHSIENKSIREFESDFGPMIYTRFGEQLYSAILELKNSGINVSKFQQLFSEELINSRQYAEDKSLLLTHNLQDLINDVYSDNDAKNNTSSSNEKKPLDHNNTNFRPIPFYTADMSGQVTSKQTIWIPQRSNDIEEND